MLFLRFLGRLVICAPTLAFARVLSFATIVSGLAAALAFTRILSLARMLALLVVSQSTNGGSRFALGAGGE